MAQSASPLPELPAIGFIADLPAEHRAFLSSFGKFIRLEDGDIVIEEGSPQDSVYLILSGMLEVFITAEEENVPVAMLGAGDSIGEINIFDPLAASASVAARSECLVWRISCNELQNFFDADPTAGLGFTFGLLKLAGQRLRAMNAKMPALVPRKVRVFFEHARPDDAGTMDQLQEESGAS